MGCCVSTNNTKPPTRNLQTPPPPPPEEEETVKEVLSETPSSFLPKKPAIIPARQENHHDPRKLKSLNDVVLKKPITVFNHSGEVSDACSNISTASYSTELNDDGQRSFRDRLLSGDSRRERVAGKSPAKRSEPSPGRVRPGSGRDVRGLGGNVGQRRDCGESSGRRSRSPATRTDNGGSKTGLVRSGSARKTGKSPGRVKSEGGGKIRMVEDPSSNFSTSSRENKWQPTSNESLENPLVSLECFIFL